MKCQVQFSRKNKKTISPVCCPLHLPIAWCVRIVLETSNEAALKNIDFVSVGFR